MRYICPLLTLIFIFMSQTAISQSNTENVIRYLPLGDSYTICEGASQKESWPYLLTLHLKQKGTNIELLGNPSVTGYTTQDLIDNELPLFDKLKPNLITLLIGVNDYVQGRNADQFKEKFLFILDHVQKGLPDKSKVILITIPDYSVTPNGAQYARGRDVTKDITLFNDLIKEEGKKRGLYVVDIFPSTMKMKDNPSLTSEDGLHPSAKEYANWETILLPTALKLLSK